MQQEHDNIELSSLMSAEAALAIQAIPAEAAAGNKRRYAREVPASLKFFTLPENINPFIKDIYPNMKIMVTSAIGRVASAGDIDEVINTFVLYMLSESPKHGVLRFTLYDPVRWPDQPYYKWFLSNLQFFCMDYHSNKARYERTFSAIQETTGEYEEANRGMTSLDELSYDHQTTSTSIDYVYAMEIMKSVEEFSAKALNRAPNKVCFENYAARLFGMKLEGYTNQEIADAFAISTQGVMAWMTKLRTLLSGILDTELEGHVQPV